MLGHGVVLVLLGLTETSLREVRRSPPDPVAVELWPAPWTTRSRPRAAATAPPAPIASRRPAAPTPVEGVAPILPWPAAGLPGAAAAPGAGLHPAPLPAPSRGDLRQALRGSPVGCANRGVVGLTRQEREACDEAYGRGRALETFIEPPMDPAKRAAFDAAAARKATARRRKEAPPPPGINPSDNAGGTRTNGIGILGY